MKEHVKVIGKEWPQTILCLVILNIASSHKKNTSFMFQIAATKPPLSSLSPPAPTEEVTYKLSEFSGEVVLIKALICLLISSETTNKMTEQHRGWLLHALFPDMC